MSAPEGAVRINELKNSLRVLFLRCYIPIVHLYYYIRFRSALHLL